ncbi:hypothetical protein BC826DRAFT_1105737 [Russula brevipes]|nr:hypothetical protein BC826DRAFT_1105737 [Russula brevipes]
MPPRTQIDPDYVTSEIKTRQVYSRLHFSNSLVIVHLHPYPPCGFPVINDILEGLRDAGLYSRDPSQPQRRSPQSRHSPGSLVVKSQRPPSGMARLSIFGNLAPNQQPSDDIIQISQRLNTLTSEHSRTRLVGGYPYSGDQGHSRALSDEPYICPWPTLAALTSPPINHTSNLSYSSISNRDKDTIAERCLPQWDAPQIVQASPGSEQPKRAARAPACGDNPPNTGSPHGPRKRHTEHASMAQAEATRDILAHTKALALSNFIACTAKKEVAHEDETCAIERTEEYTDAHNKHKIRPAAQRSTRV